MRFIKLALVVVLISLPISVEADEPKASTSASVSEKPWTSEGVCAALQWREDKLCHSQFAFTEKRLWPKDANAGNPPYQTTRMTMKCKGHSLWLEYSQDYLGVPDLRVADGVELWDGTRRLWRHPGRSGVGPAMLGGIVATPPASLSNLLFLDVMDLKNYAGGESYSKWICKIFAMPGTTFKLADGTDAGEEALTLDMAPGRIRAMRISFTFLPKKDFLMSHYKLTLVNRADGFLNEWKATETKQLDGIWLPSKIDGSIGDNQQRNVIRCTLDTFRAAAPDDADMKVPFPPGTHVMDSLKMQYYTVLPDGTRKYERYFDTDTGKMVEPPPNVDGTAPATQP